MKFALSAVFAVILAFHLVLMFIFMAHIFPSSWEEGHALPPWSKRSPSTKTALSNNTGTNKLMEMETNLRREEISSTPAKMDEALPNYDLYLSYARERDRKRIRIQSRNHHNTTVTAPMAENVCFLIRTASMHDPAPSQPAASKDNMLSKTNLRDLVESLLRQSDAGWRAFFFLTDKTDESSLFGARLQALLSEWDDSRLAYVHVDSGFLPPVRCVLVYLSQINNSSRSSRFLLLSTLLPVLLPLFFSLLILLLLLYLFLHFFLFFFLFFLFLLFFRLFLFSSCSSRSFIIPIFSCSPPVLIPTLLSSLPALVPALLPCVHTLLPAISAVLPALHGTFCCCCAFRFSLCDEVAITGI
jgi:hypothetical protein